MADAPVNYCSHCGAKVTTLKARFCKYCGAALAGNEPTQIVAPQPVGIAPQPVGIVKVKEFQHHSGYAGWLQANQGKVKIINVATTKRWGLAFGFLGRAKTYTVTYEVSAESERNEENGKLIMFGLFFVLTCVGLILWCVWN